MAIVRSKTLTEDNKCQGDLGIKMKSWSHLDSCGGEGLQLEVELGGFASFFQIGKSCDMNKCV